ncbi:MAG: 7-cyano-7-deazaguanine synthase [Polyangiaceae bacterium]
MNDQVTRARRVEGTVVLVSGGVDSTVLLYKARAASRLHGTLIFPLFIDYAQRASRREQHAADWHCRQLGLSLHTLDLAQLGESFRNGQVMKRHVPLPHRNLVALSLALSYLELVRCTSLAIGVIQDDLDGYPSASLAFLESFRNLTQTLSPARIEAPLVGWSKVRVVTEGRRLGVDFGRTYSCMVGREQHCGRCTQCQRRLPALAQLA